MSQCRISGFLEKALKCSFGNTSTIKAYVAYDSLYLEEERDPEWCQQEKKINFSIVLACFFSSQNVWKAIRK